MTKLFFSLILITYMSARAQTIVYSDRILAKVNGKVITSFELNEMTKRAQARIEKTYSPAIAKNRIAELKQSALQQFIENIIILDEFKTKQFKVPKSLIDKELERDIKKRANGERQKFAQMLDSAGMSMEEYREQIMESLSVELMVNENVRRKINVTPVDISLYYESNKVKFLKASEVRYADIFIYKKGKSDDEFDQKVQSIKDELKKGDFSKIADKYSELPNKAPGGDRGFRKFSELSDAFKVTLEKMSIGEISTPQKLGENTFFLKLLEKKGGASRPLLEVRRFIKNLLEDKQERKYYKEFIATVRKKANIQVFTKK